MHISKVKLPFYPPCEVKCRLQNRVSTDILRQQQGLLQGLGQVVGMPFLELPDGGAPRYGYPLQL